MRQGEGKRFEGLTRTFHRGYDPVLIVSDQALYVPRQLYTGRTKRGTWVRLPIECVREMEIRDASNRFYATVGGLMSAGGVVGLITTVLGGLRGSRWGSLALCALALWIGLEVIRGGAGGSTLIIHHAA